MGWKAFQDFCITVLGEVIGQTVRSAGEGPDVGRDALFEGTWRARGALTLHGQFVAQAKHTSRDATLAPSALAAELPKIKELARRDRCDNYILMTNARVSGRNQLALRSAVRAVGVREVLVFQAADLARYVIENPRLRAIVPRVYGLGDLSEILDERAYRQARAILAYLRDDISRFVVTSPYLRALQILEKHGFVLLLGEPAAGKTTIAATLAVAAMDTWHLDAAKADSVSVFLDHWNPDHNQFFWIDDAFGTTQYQAALADDWNRVLTQLASAVSKGAKIVMTSRDYIWQDARRALKLNSFLPLRDNQVVVDVEKLTDQDKQQILYNHLRLGRQPRPFKTAVKPHLIEACAVPHFLPEIARRFADPAFTHGMVPSHRAVFDFFAEPGRLGELAR